MNQNEAPSSPNSQPSSSHPVSAGQSATAMTPQQRALGRRRGKLDTYRHYLVGGDSSWLTFTVFELYNLLLSPMPSVLGMGARSFALKALLGEVAAAPAIGRGVTIRQPRSISLGKNVTIDDYAALHCSGSVDEPASIRLGDNCLVGRETIIAAKNGSIELGEACNLGSQCRIATQSSIRMGKSVLVAAYAYIGPGNHRTDDPNLPIMEQGMDIRGGVEIGDNTWIGARATIVDGVRIGCDCIIGAHSLVLHDVPDRAVVAGAPAKVLRIR